MKINEGRSWDCLKGLFKSLLLCGILGVLAEIAAGIALAFILSYVPETALGYKEHVSSQLQEGVKSVIYVVILSPIIEEFIFRFFILGVFNRVLGFMIANIIQAVMFGLYHLNLIQGIYAFLLGLLIGLLKKYTGTVWGCVCFHAMFNLTGLLINLYPVNDAGIFVRIIVEIVVSAAGVGIILLLRRKQYELHIT
ncbi:MAG: CPBP family intramembrane metalloprotease [Lachnospiraceae bacterium]|nr:CPBP family intramembrane metalloprotease [Lachnospiraceae bacterium]